MSSTVPYPKQKSPQVLKDKRLEAIYTWFTAQGWTPFAFQEETWQRYLDGQNGLLQVATGQGKTYAAVMAPLAELLKAPATGLKLLYVTPLRAVARDIEKAITRPITEMNWDIRVESRTGDSKQSLKRKQLKSMPDILITTPESLALMLSYAGAKDLFSKLRAVILDEWHELLSTKRGTLTELCMTRLRTLAPALQTWALSATLANPKEAAKAATGLKVEPVIVTSDLERHTHVVSILPERVDSFPWAGHLGMSMVQPLVARLDPQQSTLIFTNTRRQAERWYEALVKAAPQHADTTALHHASISRLERERVEARVKSGELKWVVATSSLDLGVDFQPVERVVQIGSPKAVARLLQRAGRAEHLPGGRAEVLFVPTNALELFELAALRKALQENAVEKREPLEKPYDVLAQHLVTLACGDGFQPERTFEEIKGSAAYQSLTQEEFDGVLEFITKGGKSLSAYPEYQKVLEEDSIYKVTRKGIATRHRMTIGTITSEGSIVVKFTNRRELGILSERFLSRLKKGDVFSFAGRKVELVMVQGMVAYVKNTTRPSTRMPSWTGGRLAMSASLADYVRESLQGANRHLTAEEQAVLQPILRAFQNLSHLPSENELLIEEVKTREGNHLFVYPFEGQHVHEGLAALLSYRMAKLEPGSFAITINDYGFELLTRKGYPFKEVFTAVLKQATDLESELREALNLSELAKRHFREVAQIAGLVFSGPPGAKRAAWQLQASSSTIYNVLREYEPGSLLLKQAEREVLEGSLERERLVKTLERLQSLKLIWQTPKRPSPFGFPLLVDRLSTRLSNEDLLMRIMRLKQQWQKYG
jgi:ATP-dependent helicase Lhr and Lhr-like helicase